MKGFWVKGESPLRAMAVSLVEMEWLRPTKSG